jgi:hypothetical protein
MFEQAAFRPGMLGALAGNDLSLRNTITDWRVTDELGVDKLIDLIKRSATIGLADPLASQDPRENTEVG